MIIKLVAYIDNNEIEDDDLISIIKAPDFPTGGIIYGYSDVKAVKKPRKPRAKRAETAEGEEAPKKATRKRTTKKAAAE